MYSPQAQEKTKVGPSQHLRDLRALIHASSVHEIPYVLRESPPTEASIHSCFAFIAGVGIYLRIGDKLAPTASAAMQPWDLLMVAYLSGLLERTRFRRLMILAHDSMMVASAFPFAICLRENFVLGADHVASTAYGALLLLALTAIVFRTMGVQQTMWRYASPRDLLHLAKALLIVTAVFFPLMFLIDRLDGIPRSVLIIFWFVAFAGLCTSRMIYVWGIQSHAGRLGSRPKRGPCRILVMANLQLSSSIIHTIRTEFGHAADVVGIVGNGGEQGRLLRGVEILGRPTQLSEILTLLDVAGRYPHAIIFGEPALGHPTDPDTDVKHLAPGIRFFTAAKMGDLAAFIASRPNLVDLFTRQTLSKRPFDAKRLFDIVTSLIALLLLLPLLALIACLLWIFHGSPIMFTQVRAGRHLREFGLVKFRTMRPPFDGSGHTLPDSERVTWIGSLLRATRLDELPQFWNVLCGDMSLIGPRPLLRRDMPSDIDVLAERYCVRPGITGWAQVNGGHKIANEQKMLLDLFYIRNSSLIFDIKIVILTIKMITFGEKINELAIKNAESITAIR